MTRRVRYHASFRDDLAVHIAWLARHRPPEQRAKLRGALIAFTGRIGRFPGLGREIERRDTVSHRVRPLGASLPYLVWYSYDTADERAPVSLLMLMHQAQDRERFDPGPFD